MYIIYLIYQHEHETLIVFRGLENDVKAAKEEVEGIVSKYLKENAFIPVSRDVVNCCEYLRKTNLDVVQKETNTTINYSTKYNTISISGKEEDVQKTKKLIEEKLEGKVMLNMNLDEQLKGIVIGKGGSKLKEFQTEYNVSINSRDKGTLLIWGKDEDCKKAKDGIDVYVKETVKIEKEISVNQKNIIPFVIDNFAILKKIQDETGVHIQLPRKEEMQISSNMKIVVRGNYRQAQEGYEYVMDVINNRKRYRLELTLEQIEKLEKGGFNVDRVRKETGCRIDFNKENATCIIIGTEQNLAKAKGKILNMLFFYYPDAFFTYKINDVYKYYILQNELPFLTHESKKLDEFAEKTGAKLELDVINHNIWCSGTPEQINEVKGQITDFISELRKRNAVVYVEQSVIPIIIGKKGAKIIKLREESGANISINNDNKIFINGDEDKVLKAKELIETLVTETGKLNKAIPIPHSAISSILGSKGNNIRKVENETNTYITIDKEEDLVNIRGSTEEDADKAREIIENMIKEFNATRVEKEKEKASSQSRKKEDKETSHIPPPPTVQSNVTRNKSIFFNIFQYLD